MLMKCTKCGKEMREGREKVGIENGVAVYNTFAHCDNCNQKVNLDTLKKSKEPKKNSTLSVWACALSLFGCTSLIALILAVVDLCKNDKTKKHIGSWFALIMCTLYLIVFVPKIARIDSDDKISLYQKSKTDEVSFSEENEKISQEIKKISEKEIIFRDIAWESSFSDVSEKLVDWNLWNLSGEAYRTCSVDEIMLGDYKGIDFEYRGINVVSNAYNKEQEVAGYTTEEITLYFSYLPVDGYLTYDEKDTALYGAQYKFEPVNLQDTYDDLKQKLIDIYGEPAKVTEDIDLWKNKYTYTYWYGKNDTELVLRSLNSKNDTTDLYNDEIYITFAWRNGDVLLKNASDAVKKEKSDKEQDAKENGNSDGL